MGWLWRAYQSMGWSVYLVGAMLALTVWLVYRVCRRWASVARAAKAVTAIVVLATVFTTFWLVRLEEVLGVGSDVQFRLEESSEPLCWMIAGFSMWLPSAAVAAFLTRRRSP